MPLDGRHNPGTCHRLDSAPDGVASRRRPPHAPALRPAARRPREPDDGRPAAGRHQTLRRHGNQRVARRPVGCAPQLRLPLPPRARRRPGPACAGGPRRLPAHRRWHHRARRPRVLLLLGLRPVHHGRRRRHLRRAPRVTD